MFGGSKAKKLVDELDRVYFFGLEEPQQLEVLDKINEYTKSKTKLNALVEYGLLSKFANLLAGVKNAKILPIPQTRLMELLTMFAKLDEIKVKLGVGAELCQILMHEIEELVDKVDGLISSSERAALKSKRTKLNLIRNIEKKKETLQPHKFKVKFLLNGPLGIKLKAIDPKDPKKGSIIKELPTNGLGSKEPLIKVGDRVLGYNNKVFSNQTYKKIESTISNAKRPIVIQFQGKRYGKEIKHIDETLINRHENEKSSRIKQDLISKGKDLDKLAKKKEKKKGEPYEYECNFLKGSLGIHLRSRRKDGRGAVVDMIEKGSQAEKMGGIHIGHVITGVNDEDVRNEYVKELKRMLGMKIRKMKKKDVLKIRFQGIDKYFPPGFEYDFSFQAGSIGLELAARDALLNNGAVITRIVDGSQADNSGKCREGHQIIAVAGTQCINKTLKEIKTLLVKNPRPIEIKFQVRDYEKEEKERLAREFDKKKREDEALAKKRAPIKTVIFEKGPHGIYLEKIPGRVRGVRILKTARNSAGAEHNDIYQGLEIVSINGEDFTKRMLKPAEKKMGKMSYPWTLVVKDDWLAHFEAGMKMEASKGEHKILWNEKNGSLDFTIKPNPSGSFGCVVGAMKEEVKNGFAAMKGLKTGWPLLRINDVDVTQMTMNQIDELFKIAKVKRPLSITYMILTEEELKDIANKASKKRIAGIATKLGKKKLNLRGLLWSMAPKARKEAPLPQNAEIALQMIPEYCKVLYELCDAEPCTEAACSEEAFFAIAKGLNIFLKCKSRVEKEVRGALLKLSRLLIDSSHGIERFLNTSKLIDQWINILYAEEQILPIHDLAYVLHKVTEAPGTTDREDFSSLYVFRVGINKLNAAGPKMLKAKEPEGELGFFLIASTCLLIFDVPRFVEPLMNSYMKPPGLLGLWTLLAKTRKLKSIAVITELVAKVNLNNQNKLFALQNKVPSAATIPPFNALHVLVMSMHRTGMQNKQTIFEYEVTFEPGPLGLLLDKAPGQRVGVIVHGVREDSQADDLEVIEEGDILAAIGETDTRKYNVARALNLLKSAPRPIKLKFHKQNVSSEDPSKRSEFECKFNSGPMGISMDSIPGAEVGAVVTDIMPKSQATLFKRLNAGDVIVEIAGKNVENDPIGVIMKKLTSARRPVFIKFRDPNPKSENDILADRNLVSATRLLGAILHYQSSPGAMAIRLAQRRKAVSKGDVGKKAGNKLFKRFKAKKAGKEAEEEDKAEAALKLQKISLDHPLDGLMMVDDALILTDLIFKRLLKTPHPSFELAYHMFEVVELITCVDPDKIGELSIPGFLHMATLEEEDTTMTYAAHVLEVATASIARQAAKYGQSFCELLVTEGGTAMSIRSFNRIEEAYDQAENKPLMTGDVSVLKWNDEVCNLLTILGRAESEQITVFLKESGEELVPNLFYISDVVRKLGRMEQENLDALIEQGDYDGDGVIDDLDMLKDVNGAKARVNLLRKIEGTIYEGIYRFCRNNNSCRDELTDIAFIPTTINALQSMATLETRFGTQGIVALSRLLLLLTFDEDRLDPLLSDKGAVSSTRSFCSIFTRLLNSSDDEWNDYGGICIPAQNIAQVAGQILRLIDIDVVLDHHGGQPLCRPLAFRVQQLISRILHVNDTKFPKFRADKKSCILALVIILYEMASINNNRVMLVGVGVPEALCEVMSAQMYPKTVMVSAAGAMFNLTCSKAAALKMQETHSDGVLQRLVRCIQSRVEGPHCQSLLIAALRNIVTGTRLSTLRAAAAVRHIIPTFQLYLGEAAHVGGLHKLKRAERIFTNEDEDFLPSLVTEALQCMKFITHVKVLELTGVRERVLTARNVFPAGLMSVDTLAELHKRRRATHDEDIRIVEEDDTPMDEVHATIKEWHTKAIDKGLNENAQKAYVKRKCKARSQKFYDVFLSQNLLFNKYDHVDFDVVDAMIHSERDDPSRSINVVKWVDFEFYGEKLKEDKIFDKHTTAIWREAHEGYDIETMPEEMQKRVGRSKKSHYIGSISTASTLEIHNTKEIEYQKNARLDDVDALNELNREIQERQEQERKVLRDKLHELKNESVGGGKVLKSQLAKLGLTLMNTDFYGERLNAHSPENIKRFNNKFSTTISPNHQDMLNVASVDENNADALSEFDYSYYSNTI